MSESKVEGTDPVGGAADVPPPVGATGQTSDSPAPAEAASDAAPATATGTAGGSDPATSQAAGSDAARRAEEAEEERPGVVIRDKRKVKDPGKADTAPAEQSAAAPAGADTEAPVAVEQPATEPANPFGAELESLRGHVDELTRDLQRITAEYANYRKRIDRDRGLVSEQATGTVLTALLPMLDDIDRAREHGDLVGPFGSVAEQLVNSLTKFGLSPFGEKGDPFDPTRHEAVAHQTSTEVTEPTCVEILRRGYLLGDRLLRPALVAVADPEH
jgi:molecular chaperone GrpE